MSYTSLGREDVMWGGEPCKNQSDCLDPELDVCKAGICMGTDCTKHEDCETDPSKGGMEGSGCYYGYCQCPPGVETLPGKPYTRCGTATKGKILGLSRTAFIGVSVGIALLAFLEIRRRQ